MEKLVLFDMDGTTLYTLVDLYNAMLYALQKNELPPIKMDDFRLHVGMGMRSEVIYSVPKGTSDEVIDKVLEDFQLYYKQHANDNAIPYSGILELLAKLKENHIHTAIVSNKGDADVKALSQLHFNNLFEISIGETSVVPRKPDPAMVNQVIEDLHVDKMNCIYVGDSEVDIETARNAGIQCVIVSWGYRDVDFLKKYGASCIVNTVEELESVIVK